MTNTTRRRCWLESGANHSHFDGKTAGFHLNGLYSPLGWASWSELAEDFLRAKNDPAALRTFINTRLAETYEENYLGAG